MKVIIALSFALSVMPFYLSASPNMILKEGAVACKTLDSLNYAERIRTGNTVLEVHKSRVNNNCTTIDQDKNVTAFSVGVTSKVEFFALSKLDIYYVNTRDLMPIISVKE